MAADSDPASAKEIWRKELRPLRTKIDPSAEVTVVAHLVTFLEHVAGSFLFYRAMSTELQLDSLADQLGWERYSLVERGSAFRWGCAGAGAGAGPSAPSLVIWVSTRTLHNAFRY